VGRSWFAATVLAFRGREQREVVGGSEQGERALPSPRGTPVEEKLEPVYEEVTEIVYRSGYERVMEQRIEAGCLPLRYLRAGEGPPLVLLHGVGDNSLDWRWVLPVLARTHRVYAPDLPGSPAAPGPSPNTTPPPSSARSPRVPVLARLRDDSHLYRIPWTEANA
jgi:hypothetical protein